MPLTGAPLDSADDIPDRPALVVKIDNAPAARPQSGLGVADIVIEEIVNDGLTRFGAVFHADAPETVGPIRSGRLQDVDLFGSFQQPLFAWSGGNATVTNAIRASDLVELNQGADGMFRESSRRAPSNLYGVTETFWEQAEDEQSAPPQHFAYRTDDDDPQGDELDELEIRLDAIRVDWTWDPDDEVYRRDMNGNEHVDLATEEQITTHNVVILEMQYASGISGSPDAISIGEGTVFVLTDGRLVTGTWSRDDRLEPWLLLDESGDEILLTAGRTFIELPRVGGTQLPDDG